MTKSVPHSLMCAIVLASLAVLVCSCSPGSTTLHIQTNVPELANLAGMYMLESGSPLVEIEYRDQLVTSNPDGAVPDLVIGTGLYNTPALDKLSGLENLFKTAPIETSRYYPFTFQKYKDETTLVVLSWDLPAIVSYLPDASLDFNESVLLPLEGLTDKAAQFNTTKKGSLHALGFSPLYSDEFLYLMFQYSGAAISADNRGYPEWNEDNVNAAIKLLNKWSTSYNGGPQTESAFIAKYAYGPVFQLLTSHRFTYAYSRASDFLILDQANKANLSLHWPTWQNRLRLLDNFVAAGIPQGSSHHSEALQFIRWLLDPEVQKHILVKNLDDGLRGFGFLGGFSSQRDISEKTIPQYFPAVRLRVPPESILDFPALQGMLWPVFKQEIFGNWARSTIIANKAETPLRKVVSQWLLQMGLNP